MVTFKFKHSFEFYSEMFDKVMEEFESIYEQYTPKYGKNYCIEDLPEADREIHVACMKLVMAIVKMLELRGRYDENPTAPIC